MVDNEYSRTKMRGFVMGLNAALYMIAQGDDPTIFHEQVRERIRECCTAWKIELPTDDGEE